MQSIYEWEMEVPLAAGDHSCDCAEIIWQWLAQEVRDGFGYNARFVVIVPATETGWIKSGGASGVSNHPEHRCRSLFVYVLSHRCGMHAPVYFRVTYWVADFQNFFAQTEWKPSPTESEWRAPPIYTTRLRSVLCLVVGP